MVGFHNSSDSSDVVVGTFSSRSAAQRAIEELIRAGFQDDQIGVVSRDSEGQATDDALGGIRGTADTSSESTGVLTGAAAGAGGGALWGLGIAAGVLPAIGPVIAGGVLAAIAASAAAGAAAGGVLGALIGLGVPEEDARRYEQDFEAGRTLVTVRTVGHREQAEEILRRHGGFERANSDINYTDTMAPDDSETLGRTTAGGTSRVPSHSSIRAAETAPDQTDLPRSPRGT